MLKLTSVKTLQELLREYSISPSKQRGQNFLIDENILKKIVDSADIDNENCLEIGPGAGTMTQELCRRAKRVIAVELDNGLYRLLSDTLKGQENLKLIHADALKVDFASLCKEGFKDEAFSVVANLPYYITTAIIIKLLQLKRLNSMTFLVQKEVAQRLSARPGTKDYGSLTIFLSYYTQSAIMGSVPPGCFYPAPKVDSVILNLRRLEKPPVDVSDEEFFFSMVRTAFSQRRKTLLNNLSMLDGKAQIESLLNKCGIDPKRRSETLTIEEYALICNEFIKTGKK